MTERAFQILLASLWAAAIAGLSWYCLFVARQITYVTLADGRRQERRLPLIFRLLLPLAPNLAPVFDTAAFAKMRDRLARKITAAGFEDLLTPTEFLALRVILPLLLGTIWCLLMVGVVPHWHGPMGAKLGPLVYAMGPLWCVVYPGLWLQQALSERHRSIQRALPFTLDILTLSVEAGMDFMTALRRNTEQQKIDALNEELIRVVRLIQLGKTRREALRDLSGRVSLPDLRSVVNALVQADELGVSIGSILRIQSDQMRQRRFERAERLANEAPVKMLAPLMLFIFPSVFIVLLGPIMVRVIQQGF
ncbi:MAG: type II secretion system F family protein [Kiritimatiellia bacterium]|jgi:tight adherence protein C|nr:type II secretion system F family protein [Kiritimatiellia bacterium]MDP6631169.1 type II secretion system F family protein [Kiritimatiellia bacterium]MDP6809809.1 type II secretion system F family protein [Kiritimatiellia bacterium]MDP7025081.1 type II secretion system F family protein [Kiritimatiellia bacterium]